MNAPDAVERLRATMAGQIGGGMTCMDADDARAILDHIAALTASLKAANNNHEHFEREWYLRGDEIERLTAERDAAVAAVNRQANAVRALHANEETEINRLRKQRHEWHHAVSSLDSEREANARLTEEIERLTAERDAAMMEAKAYWYRQGKDDGVQHEREDVIRWLRKEAIMSTDTVRRRMNKALDQIEAGAHLKA